MGCSKSAESQAMAIESTDSQSVIPSKVPDWQQLPPKLALMSAYSSLAAIAFAAAAAVATLLALESVLRSEDFGSLRVFDLWALIMSVQVALWVVFASLLMRHLSLMIRGVGIRLPGDGVRTSLTRRVAGFVLTVWIVVGVSLAVTSSLDLLLGASEPVRKAVLVSTVVGGLAALPALATASLIREFASSDALWPPGTYGAADFAFIQFLRSEFRTVVGMLGVVVALIVLATGALSNALDAGDALSGTPIEGNMRTTLVLLSGALYSGLLIAGYIYGRAAINRRASEMLDAWAPLPATSDATTLETGLEWRQSLGGHLGLETTLREGLATTAIVALPLLSAFMSSVVGQGLSL